MLRRLEARGDIRGGRFVAGVTGEQFALPEAVAMLRDTRRAPPTGAIVSVSGADPLNLVGTVLPGAKVPALTAQSHPLSRRRTHRRAVRRRHPMATALEPADARAAEDALIKRQPGSPLLAYLR